MSNKTVRPLMTMVFQNGFLLGTFPNEQEATAYIERNNIPGLYMQSYYHDDLIKLVKQKHLLQYFIENVVINSDYTHLKMQAQRTLNKVDQMENVKTSVYMSIDTNTQDN